MTFGSTFGRTFSPTFQPSSQAAAAASSWWLAGGIDPANCVAAYQPKGAAALSSALGSIAIDDLATGDITITLDETATDDLSTGTYVYDIQMISAAGVKTLTYGRLIVSADVTRLVA